MVIRMLVTGGSSLVGCADVVALEAGLRGPFPAEGVGSVLAQAAPSRTVSAGVASRVRRVRRELRRPNVTTTAVAVIRRAFTLSPLAANRGYAPTDHQRREHIRPIPPCPSLPVPT